MEFAVQSWATLSETVYRMSWKSSAKSYEDGQAFQKVELQRQVNQNGFDIIGR